jgi:ribose transport system ATP-binding protein
VADPQPTAVAGELLEIRGLVKQFTSTRALDGVDFTARRGEVHALLGENGAGKSTLIKILAGVHRPDAGAIRFGGRPVDPSAETLPIAFIHQDLGLADTMTVAENISLVAGYSRRLGLIDWAGCAEIARQALASIGSPLPPEARVSDLSIADKSLVAIARALAVRADLLVLDEPTASLPETDVARLLRILRGLAARGIAILYVTHRLDEVFRVADHVTVLRDGRSVFTGRLADTTHAQLVHCIVGRALDQMFVSPRPPTDEPVLTVRGLRVRHAGPISFMVAAGEVVGLVGLRGAGHDTIGRALFGDIVAHDGEASLNGQPLQPRTPAEGVRMGVGLVSAKRREESLAPSLSVRENLFPNPGMMGVAALQPMSPTRESRKAASLLARFSVRPRETERPVITLSGGNQQKVVVARWFEAGVRLLVLEEPTYGVDVGSKAEIYALLQDALDRRLAVLLVSSDFEEVAGVCHRALVFDRGRVVAELPRSELSVSRLTALASSGESGASMAALPAAEARIDRR